MHLIAPVVLVKYLSSVETSMRVLVLRKLNVASHHCMLKPMKPINEGYGNRHTVYEYIAVDESEGNAMKYC